MPTDPPADVNLDWLGGLAALGWREIVLVLAGLLVLYVVFVFFRLRRIDRPPTPARNPPAATPDLGTAADPLTPPVLMAREVPLDSFEEDMSWGQAPALGQDERRLEIIEREIVSMRDQLDALRETVRALGEELRGEISSAAAQVKAGQHLSPLYGDAMQMAMAGHDAATISERCGIARAEAELVAALAQQSRQADERENDDGHARY